MQDLSTFNLNNWIEKCLHADSTLEQEPSLEGPPDPRVELTDYANKHGV